ncbi:hypothetical protein [Oligoflexus tunisiensis]|uniref:hypothetical protein n=1 Tax=Oligoflexus tunisiensis TaxID=708132 RepID=UPI00114D0CCB|nr:hypothetical protein [Oligoflexus tunisiensis]
MKSCCKEWALKVEPRQACPDNQVGFEEEHACPTCHENYLLWFTSIGSPDTKGAQTVPVTIKPAQDILDA